MHIFLCCSLLIKMHFAELKYFVTHTFIQEKKRHGNFIPSYDCFFFPGFPKEGNRKDETWQDHIRAVILKSNGKKQENHNDAGPDTTKLLTYTHQPPPPRFCVM